MLEMSGEVGKMLNLQESEAKIQISMNASIGTREQANWDLRKRKEEVCVIVYNSGIWGFLLGLQEVFAVVGK